MSFPRLVAYLVCWLVACSATVARAADAQDQTAGAREGAQVLRVFVDCRANCDFDFLRTEITFVDYVRDRKDADVHVLVTTQRTGGGGQEYTLKFIGLERFAGRDDTLRYVSAQTDTDDQRRRGLAQVLTLGLVRYVAETPLASELQVRYRPRAGGPAAGPTTPAEDPWNFWIFRASTSGNLFAEQRTRRGSLRASVSANRTTEALKVSANTNINYNENRFNLADEDEPPNIYVSIRRDYNVSGLLVKSLTGRWSAAARVSMSSSTFTNQKRAVRVWTGLEYNVFPYEESTRRAFVFNYTLGPNWVRYHEVTIFDKLDETLYTHQFLVALSLRQPWGSGFVEGLISQYLHDTSKNRIELNGRVEVRLFRGFTFDVGGEVSRIRDQIYLPAGGATLEEILVLRRQLATGYRYTLNWGVSYTFGSIYNNVVNPRFEAR